MLMAGRLARHLGESVAQVEAWPISRALRWYPVACELAREAAG